MPNQDGTGPRGQGQRQRQGQGRGRCGQPGQTNQPGQGRCIRNRKGRQDAAPGQAEPSPAK